MTLVRVRGFKIFNDRHGKPRCYHRATGAKIDLDDFPLGSLEFFAECNRFVELAENGKPQACRPGTLGAFIEYCQTDHFRNLADVTRSDYIKCADYPSPISDTPIFEITTPLVAGIHDKAARKMGWRRATMLRTFLGQVFRFSIPQGLIDKDYAKDVIPKPRPKDRPYANRPWSTGECAVVLERAAPHVRVAIALIMNTGLDPTDALNLRRHQIDGGTIWGVRGKTQNEIDIPIGPTLQAALDAAPGHNALTIVASSNGTPWTYNGFSTVWHRFKKKLEDESAVELGLTLKGLRHTVATTLREAGLE